MLRRLLEAVAITAFICLVIQGGYELQRANLAQENALKTVNESPTLRPARDAPHKEGEKDDWLKPTDRLLVVFTLALAVYTRQLYQATVGLRETAEQQRADMLQSVRVAEKAANAAQASAQAAVNSVQIAKDFVERGYVFGGCGLGANTGNEIEGLTKTVAATQGNYGKTPVFVQQLFLEQCHENDLPMKPVYKNSMVVNEPLPPDGTFKPVNAKEAIKIFPRTDGQMFYGRFIYLDVFKRRHYSSFIYRFFADGTHLPADDVDPEYWAWGEYNEDVKEELQVKPVLVGVLVLSATAALAEPLPLPKPPGPAGSCPHGHFSSGGFCVPAQGAQDASLEIGERQLSLGMDGVGIVLSAQRQRALMMGAPQMTPLILKRAPIGWNSRRLRRAGGRHHRRPHLQGPNRAGRPPLDVGERSQSPHPPRGARLRADARGGDCGVRQELAEGVIQMSRDEAIEKCARAMAKRRGFREEN